MKSYILGLVIVFLIGATLSAQDPAVQQPDNLLKNGGFELGRAEPGVPPDDWGFITETAMPVNGCMTRTAAHTGDYSVVLDSPKDDKNKWQVMAFNALVEGGAWYEFSIWVKPDPQNPIKGATKGQIAIEWKDADGNEISRAVGQAWTAKTFAPAGDWTEIKVKAAAPAKSSSATFTITYLTGGMKDTNSAFLIDDAVAKKLAAK
jgi:hypothetical protein